MGKHAGKQKAATAPTPPWVSTHPYGGGAWFPPAGIFRQHLDLRSEKLESLYERTEEWVGDELKHLNSQMAAAKGDDFAEDWFVGDAQVVKQQLRWARLLLFVGLYHQVESALGTLFKWRLAGHPDYGKLLFQVHKWKALEKLLLDHCGVTLSAVACNDDVNLLRMICNSVKHDGGEVSDELAKSGRTTLKVGDEIGVNDFDSFGLRQSSLKFIYDLVKQSETGVTMLLGTASSAPPSLVVPFLQPEYIDP